VQLKATVHTVNNYGPVKVKNLKQYRDIEITSTGIDISTWNTKNTELNTEI